LGGGLLAAWLSWFFFAKITVYEVSTKARLEVNRSAHPIAAQVAGKIVSTSLSLGQEVQEGNVLVELDARTEKLRLQEEESRFRALPPQIAALQKQMMDLDQAMRNDHQAALAAIQSARARQKEASSAASFAKDNARRLAELSGSGKVPLIETLRANSESQKLSSAMDALSSDMHRIQMDSETHAHEKRAEIENLKREAARLSGDLETIEITISRLNQDIEKHVIRSPATGQIGDVGPLQVGTYVTSGEKLATVVPHSELRIVANFPPASVLGRIHPGQFSRMRLEGFPWAQFGTIEAQVSHVGSEIRDNLVRVEFSPNNSKDSPIMMQHGLPGSIEVSIELISPAVMILRSAGQWLSNGKPETKSAGEFTS
jgi:membrane fusion protein (multidrug efflux system)